MYNYNNKNILVLFNLLFLFGIQQNYVHQLNNNIEIQNGKKANNNNQSPKCISEPFIEETILQGGLNAGIYKDLGKSLTDQQCQVFIFFILLNLRKNVVKTHFAMLSFF